MRRTLVVSYRLTPALFLALLAGPAGAAAFHVHIEDFTFQPGDLTVTLGDAVTWDNHDGALHTATDLRCPRAGGDGPCEFDSFNLANGASFTHTFATPGVLDYLCTIHQFSGLLVVDDPLVDPDLVVSRIAMSDVGNGVSFKRFEVDVKNAGEEDARGSRVRLAYAYQGGEVLIGQAEQQKIAVGETRTSILLWNVQGKVGDFTVLATADLRDVVRESDEGNNVGTFVASLVTPPGAAPGVDAFDPL